MKLGLGLTRSGLSVYLVTAFFKFNVLGTDALALLPDRFLPGLLGVRNLKLSSLMGWRELDSWGGVGIMVLLFGVAFLFLLFGYSREVVRFTTSRLCY